MGMTEEGRKRLDQVADRLTREIVERSEELMKQQATTSDQASPPPEALRIENKGEEEMVEEDVKDEDRHPSEPPLR